MKAFDGQLQKKGYIPMSGHIVDASLVPGRKQRNTDAGKEAIKAGKMANERSGRMSRTKRPRKMLMHCGH
jgi:hypothetical protein